MKKTNQNKASFREKMETETYNNFYFNNLTLDKKGNVISRKKRVNDTKMVDALLSYKSKLKLTLKQYKFVQQMKLRENCSENQREWLKELYKKQQKL
jgi:hypothetical protein